MEYIVAAALLGVLLSFGYMIGTYLHRDKGMPIEVILFITSPLWVTMLFAIYLALEGKI